MLARLYIENIAVISKSEVEFSKGLNCLTGETGAGKSIIIDSLGLTLGQRASRELIRTGEEKAQVTALFYINSDATVKSLAEFGIHADDESNLILQREINVEGKSTCRINGAIVPLSQLKEAGSLLVSIHGQQDSQALYSPEKHIRLLDAFSSDILLAKEKYHNVFIEYRKANHELLAICTDATQRQRELDMLNYQISEIDSARLNIGEDEDLEERRRFLANAEKIISSLDSAYQGQSNARESISKILKELSGIHGLDNNIESLYSEIVDISCRLDDASSEMLRIKDMGDFNPSELDAVEERLETIKSLKRKYGSSIKHILEFYENSIQRRDELLNSEKNADEITVRLKELEAQLAILSDKLTAERKRAATALENGIKAELSDLEMAGAGFVVKFDEELDFTADGKDKVEFLIAPNQGEDAKPLAKIASGGELSRIMLAIKTVMSSSDNVSTYIFDEIDTGVSGRAAAKVAKKLFKVSTGRQAICISHLGQIAAMSDRHYLIEKNVNDGRTITTLKALDYDGRIAEIARINAGSDITQAALTHAKEMIMKADEYKK